MADGGGNAVRRKEFFPMVNHSGAALKADLASVGPFGCITFELQSPVPAGPGRFAVLDPLGDPLLRGSSRDLSDWPAQVPAEQWLTLMAAGATWVAIWPDLPPRRELQPTAQASMVT